MFNWLKKRKWLVVNSVLIGLLVSLLGIQVMDKQDAVDRSVKIGIGNEMVITLGHIAYAAGSVDYTYDGVDDDVQFLAALNALPATGGRIVDVSAVQKNFGATVTRAIPNVTIEGTGFGSYFVNDGGTALFTAGGNGWTFDSLRTDAGGINMGATTGWLWLKVDAGSGTVYDVRAPAGSIVNGAFTASSVTDSGLTNGRVPIAGVGGLLGDSSNLTFDGNSLQVGGANVTRSATYVVAASDAPAHVKAQADAVCDGTADQIEINIYTAIDGADVFLASPGKFTISAPIKITADNVHLHGGTQAGYDGTVNTYSSTVIELADNSDCNIIEGPDADKVWWATIDHLTLYGDYTNQASGNGINFTRMNRSRFNDLKIFATKNYGMYVDYSIASSEEHVLNNITCQWCQGGGFYLRTNITPITNCYALHTPDTKYGFTLYGGSLRMIGCDIDGGTSRWGGGVQVLGGSSDITIIGCTFYKLNDESIYLLGGRDFRIIGNSFYDNDGIAIRLRTTYGDINNVVLQGNVVHSFNTPADSLQIDGTGNAIYDSVFSGNILDKGTGVDLQSPPEYINNIWNNNVGYIAPAEIRTASGTLTAGNTTAIAFSWHNPETQDIYIKKVVVTVTTAGGTAGAGLQVGIADDAAGTNLGTEFANTFNLNATGVYDSWYATDNGTQVKWVLCQDSASATDGWVVGKILVANAASLEGSYYIEYAGK